MFSCSALVPTWVLIVAASDVIVVSFVLIVLAGCYREELL